MDFAQAKKLVDWKAGKAVMFDYIYAVKNANAEDPQKPMSDIKEGHGCSDDTLNEVIQSIQARGGETADDIDNLLGDL